MKLTRCVVILKAFCLERVFFESKRGGHARNVGRKVRSFFNLLYYTFVLLDSGKCV